MKNRLNSLFRTADEDIAAGGPFYLIMYLVLVAAYVYILVVDASMRQPGRFALFTGLMIVHGALHFFSFRLAEHRRWLPAYVLVQGGIVLALGFMTQLQGLIMGLYLALVGETAGILWPDRRAIALTTSFYITLLVLNILAIWDLDALLGMAPILAGMFAFVLIYVASYIRQVQAREESQVLLQELEVAHHQLQQYADRVEELTISQERQRMARELHDTLAQGLAGLILQLEAVDSHLERDDPERARAVVQQATQRARITLQEARRAIQALRPAALEGGNLVDALGQELDQFAATTGSRTTFEVSGEVPPVSQETALDVLRIVQEGLSNVARHAGASHVLVRLTGDRETLQVMVQDDGVGFDPVEGSGQPGRYGLAGMRERAKQIGGDLKVESDLGGGTTLILRVGGWDETRGREG
jgi:NarL family two-component system sensor histidine kinase YdfH